MKDSAEGPPNPEDAKKRELQQALIELLKRLIAILQPQQPQVQQELGIASSIAENEASEAVIESGVCDCPRDQINSATGLATPQTRNLSTDTMSFEFDHRSGVRRDHEGRLIVPPPVPTITETDQTTKENTKAIWRISQGAASAKKGMASHHFGSTIETSLDWVFDGISRDGRVPFYAPANGKIVSVSIPYNNGLGVGQLGNFISIELDEKDENGEPIYITFAHALPASIEYFLNDEIDWEEHLDNYDPGDDLTKRSLISLSERIQKNVSDSYQNGAPVRVNAGQPLGFIANTGKIIATASDGTHLHMHVGLGLAGSPPAQFANSRYNQNGVEITPANEDTEAEYLRRSPILIDGFGAKPAFPTGNGLYTPASF